MKSFFSKGIIEAGCDEAGRGCLAGPVFAAAVILPRSFHHPRLRDSKKMTEKDRLLLRDVILHKAVAWGVSAVSPAEIDNINILNASFKAMHMAIDKLAVRPQLLLIDGNRFNPYPTISHQCIIRGDDLYASIAAASVLAKTYRDDHMRALERNFPQFAWAQNKGYGTPNHREVISELGYTREHRRSFVLKEP